MIKQILVATAVSATLISTNASAILYDFDAITQEQGASTLDLFGGALLVTGKNGQSSAYAYLDAGTKSGVGVCNSVDLSGDAVLGNGNDHTAGTNECAPSSDDNMQGNEWLNFTSTAGQVDGFYVWGNHVNYTSSSIFVDVDGGGNNFISLLVDANRYVDLSSWTTNMFSVKADTNAEAYISAVSVSVPEPGALALLGLGLVGLGASRRRK